MRLFADDRQMISDPCAMSRWKVIVRLRRHQRESIVIQRAILRIGASALAARVEGDGLGRGLRERVKGRGLRAERRAAALRFARNKGGRESMCARLGAEATDYGLRAARKPIVCPAHARLAL